MAQIDCDERADTDPAMAAGRALGTTGTFLMPPDDVARSLGVCGDVWTQFGGYWDDLAPDPYAAELGIRRLRRYGQYSLRDGMWRRLANSAFVQPEDSNPLYIDRDRHFESLTDAFMKDPLLHGLMNLLARLAAALDDLAEWVVKVHPFRVLSAADGDARPTPEGPHRAGVTLVSSLLVGRHNASAGESSVCDLTGRELMTATLAEPGTLILGDDRRTLHGFSPVRPIDSSRPARRDVLVITFASRRTHDRSPD